MKHEEKNILPKENISNLSSYSILEIPTIHLNKKIYPSDAEENNVDKNILNVKEEDNLLILASHSGNGKHAYFNNLDKLKRGDSIFLTKEKEKVTYYIDFIYEDEKDGRLHIQYDNQFNTLVLITCSKKNKKKQVIYIANATKKEDRHDKKEK